MTGNDIIASALRLIGALAPGETPTAAEAQDALLVANTMFDSWSTDRLLVNTIQRQGPYNLTAGQQTYTLGPGGTFNLSPVRPPFIQRMGVITLGNPAQPLELPLDMVTLDQWSAIPVKNIQSSIPTRVWDDTGFPFRTLSFWCVPNGSVGTQVVVYAWIAITQFPDLTTDVQFPPGYFRAIRYNLAVELAPEFLDGQGASPTVIAIANESKGLIQSLNAPLLDLRCDPGLVSPGQKLYNWLTDGPVTRG